MQTNQVCSVIVSVSLFFQPLGAAWAQNVTVDNARGGNTAVHVANNGAGIINIATPNSAGLSHNVYRDFNVGTAGMVLNNTSALTNANSGLAGLVPANPNLMGGTSARVILNEVSGANQSDINGIIETIGGQAQVVIANPNGIVCDGCGFINVSQATLTTGTPNFDNTGALTAFDVHNGRVVIGPNGLDARATEILDIIARQVDLNGALAGKTIRILAGTNRAVYGSTGHVIEHDVLEGISGAPVLAVSSDAFGGIYGDQISIVATERGIGVAQDTTLSASAGAMTLSAKGQLRLGTAIAKGSANFNAQGAVSAKAVSSEGDLRVSGQSIAVQSLTSLGDAKMSALSGDVEFVRATAGGAMDIDAVQGRVTSLLSPDGLGVNLFAGDRIRVDARGFTVARTLGQGVDVVADEITTEVVESRDGALTLRATNGDISAGTVMSNQDVTLDAQNGSVAVGLAVSGGNLSVATENGDATFESLSAVGALNLEVENALTAVSIAANEDVTITAGDVSGVKLLAGGALDIGAKGDIVVNQIVSGAEMTVAAGAVVASHIESWSGDMDLTLTNGGLAADELVAGGNVTVEALDGGVTLLSGYAQGYFAATAQGIDILAVMAGLDLAALRESDILKFNENGHIVLMASQDAVEAARGVQNDAGVIDTTQGSSLSAQEQWKLNIGTLLSTGSTYLSADNQVAYDTASTGADLTVKSHAGTLVTGSATTGGNLRLHSNGNINFSRNALDDRIDVNVGGVIEISGYNIAMRNSTYTFDGLILNAENALALQGANLTTRKDDNGENGYMVLSADNLQTNGRTSLTAQGTMVLDINGSLVNNFAINAQEDLYILADRFHARRDVIAGGNLVIGSMDDAGKVGAADFANLQNVTLSALKGSVAVMADAITTNWRTSVDAQDGQLIVSTKSLGGSRAGGLFGTYTAADSIDIAAGDTLDVRGILSAGGQTRLFADDVTLSIAQAPTNGMLIAGKVGQDGQMVAANSIAINAALNAQGGDVQLAADRIRNNSEIATTSGNILMLADDVAALGSVQTQSGNVTLVGNSNVTVNQGLDLGSNLTILTENLNQNGDIVADGNILIGAAMTSDGTLGQVKSVTVENGLLRSDNGNVIVTVENASDLTDITAKGSVILDTKTYDADLTVTAQTGSVAIAADDFARIAGSVTAGENIQILSSDIAIMGDLSATGHVMAAQGVSDENTFQLAENFENTGHIVADKSILIASETVQTGDLRANGTGLAIMGQDLTIDGATTAGDMSIIAGNRVILTSAQAGGNILASATGEVDIQGSATAQGRITLLGGTVSAGALGNVTATDVAIAGEYDAATQTLGSADVLTGAGAYVATTGNVFVNADVVNTDADITAERGDVYVGGHTAQSLGSISAQGSVVARFDALTADANDQIQAGENLTLMARDVVLNGGRFVAGDNVFVAGGVDENGQLLAARAAEMNAAITATNGNVYVGAENADVNGTIRAEAGDISVIGDVIELSGALSATNNLFAIANSSALVSGTVASQGEMGLFAQELNNQGQITAASNVFLGGSIEGSKPIAGAMIANNGTIESQSGNVIAITHEFTATGQITTAQGGIGIEAGNITATGSLISQDFLRLNAENGLVRVTDLVKGEDGTAIFADQIDVTRGGVVTAGQGEVYLANGIDDTGFLKRASAVNVDGIVDGNASAVRISAQNFTGQGMVKATQDGIAVSVGSMNYGGRFDAQNLGLFSDNDLTVGSVAVDGTFIGQSHDGDVTVTGTVTAGDVTLVAGDFVNIIGGRIDAVGNGALGLAGDILILGDNGVNILGNTSYSGQSYGTMTVSTSVASLTATNNIGVLTNPTYEVDQELYDLAMLYMPYNLPYMTDEIYKPVEGKEGNITVTSGVISAGNGVVFQGGKLRFDAYRTGSTCPTCTNNTSLGYVETVVASGIDALAARAPGVDTDVPTSMSNWTANDLVGSLAGDGNIVISGLSHVTGLGANFYADEILSMHSQYGSIEFHGTFEQGQFGPDGPYGTWGGYTTVNSAVLSGQNGVYITAPNGFYTNYTSDVFSASGDIVIHANHITIDAFKDWYNEYSYSFEQDSAGTTTHVTNSAMSMGTVHPVNLVAGGDLILSGATGVDITAANMASIGSTILQAGYDEHGNVVDNTANITLKPGYNYSGMSSSDRKYGLGVGSRPDDDWQSMVGYDHESVGASIQSVVSTNILAGEDIVLVATGDVYGQAVNLQAVNDINVSAGGNVTFTAAKAGSFVQENQSWGSIGVGTSAGKGSASMTLAIQTEQSSNLLWETEVVGSSLAAGGNVTIASGGDVLIEGSSIKAGETIGITADGSVSIIDAQSGSVALGYENSTFMGWTFKMTQPFVAAVYGAQSAYENLNNAIEGASGSLQDIKTPADAAARVQAMANLYHAQQSFKGAMEGLQGQIKSYATFAEKGDPSSITLVNLSATYSVSEDTTTTSSSSSTSVGSSLSANDILITAGQDVTITGSKVTAVEGVDIIAGNNVNIFPGWNTTTSHSHSHGYNFSIGISGSVDGSGGFNPGSISASYNTYSNKTEYGSTEAVPTEISGSTVNIVAGNDINSVGGILEGQDIYLTAGNNINFVAAQNTFHGSTENMSMGISASVSLGSSGISGFGFGMNQELLFSQASGTTNTYSMVTAQNQLVVTSGNDTNLIGAVFQGNDVILNVGGDLNIVSLLDTFQASGNWQYMDVSTSFDGSFKPTSASFDYGSYGFEISTATVSQQSGIIGDNSVTINVGGNTHLAGALISAPTVDLTTGSISLSNVYNHEVFTENSLNFGFNLSFTSDNFADFLQDLDPYGSSSSGFFANFWTTAPVITAPTVTVGGVEIDTADLNRHFGLRHTITQNVGAGLTQQIQDIQSLLDIRDTLNKQTQIGSL